MQTQTENWNCYVEAKDQLRFGAAQVVDAWSLNTERDVFKEGSGWLLDVYWALYFRLVAVQSSGGMAQNGEQRIPVKV